MKVDIYAPVLSHHLKNDELVLIILPTGSSVLTMRMISGSIFDSFRIWAKGLKPFSGG